MNFLIKLMQDTTFLTVISGVLIYALSQLFLEFVLIPRKDYKILKQKIIYTIELYCCYYSNPYNLLNEKTNIRKKDEYDNASKEIRKIGAELAGYIGTVFVFKKKKIQSLKKVLGSIIGISNGFYIISKDLNTIKENMECEKTIREELKF